MDLFWPYGIDLPDRSLTAILGPPAVPLAGINRCRDLSRYPFLYVCGNFSRILTGIHRTVRYSVRRGFTQDQMMTIVEESAATILFIEHDPTLYEEDRRLVRYLAPRLRQLAEAQAIVVVYSPVTDVFMREVFTHAHQVYAFLPYDRIVPPPRPLAAKTPAVPSRQSTLPVFLSGTVPDPMHRIDLGCSLLEVVEDPVGILPDLPDE